jgi:uncharacterized protein (TIGR03085 family)
MRVARRALRAERAALCDTLERLGPDAPTLCEGWRTLDLAAHLVVRERDLRSGPGLLFGGRLGRYTAKLTERATARGYEKLLRRLRAGPPRYLVLTMAAVNLNENWVHHEDARRANGEPPRPEDLDVSAIQLGVLRRMGWFQTRRVGDHGVTVEIPSGYRQVLRKGTTMVTLSGPVGECVLYLSGRKAAARVTLTGDAEAIEMLRGAKLGL